MESRPPALDLGPRTSSPKSPSTNTSSFIINSDGGARKSKRTGWESTSPPLPTPPLAKKENETQGNFELEMERALGKVGKPEHSPERKNTNPLLELSIPIGL
jgi:hypothetical protein